MAIQADYIFKNGTIISVDEQDHIYQALAVAGKQILAVGSNEDLDCFLSPNTRVIDLKGRSLTPGLIDPHCHSGYYGTIQMQVDCSPQKVGSIEEIKTAIKKRADITPKGQLILGAKYDNTKLKENRHPTRWDLDEAAPDHPVFIARTCRHIATCNSRALALFEIDETTSDPKGGKIERDSEGRATGVLYELAQAQFRPLLHPSDIDLEAGLRIMNKDVLSFGITTVCDASGRSIPEIKLYQRAVREGWNKVAVHFMVRTSGAAAQLGEIFIESGLITGFGNDRLRIGCYKLQMDGSGGGKTAAMRDPYPDDPNNFGLLHMTQEELDEKVRRAHLAGYQIAIHAIGDRAVEMCVEAYQKALETLPKEDHRHRIEHCGFLDEVLIQKIADLKLVIVLGVPFMYRLGDSYLKVLAKTG